MPEPDAASFRYSKHGQIAVCSSRLENCETCQVNQNSKNGMLYTVSGFNHQSCAVFLRSWASTIGCPAPSRKNEAFHSG